jgi:hypothetical protein
MLAEVAGLALGTAEGKGEEYRTNEHQIEDPYCHEP